jgi:hypothetical protein
MSRIIRFEAVGTTFERRSISRGSGGRVDEKSALKDTAVCERPTDLSTTT